VRIEEKIEQLLALSGDVEEGIIKKAVSAVKKKMTSGHLEQLRKAHKIASDKGEKDKADTISRQIDRVREYDKPGTLQAEKDAADRKKEAEEKKKGIEARRKEREAKAKAREAKAKSKGE
jgi:hypothetical protein